MLCFDLVVVLGASWEDGPIYIYLRLRKKFRKVITSPLISSWTPNEWLSCLGSSLQLGGGAGEVLTACVRITWCLLCCEFIRVLFPH